MGERIGKTVRRLDNQNGLECFQIQSQGEKLTFSRGFYKKSLRSSQHEIQSKAGFE